jgi:hypothetical protein
VHSLWKKNLGLPKIVTTKADFEEKWGPYAEDQAARVRVPCLVCKK